MPKQQRPSRIFIGIDIGTSGSRALAIDELTNVRAEAAVSMALPERHSKHGIEYIEQNPSIWLNATLEALTQLSTQIDTSSVAAITIDGTSATVLLSDGQGVPITAGLMYNDSRALAQADDIRGIAPDDCAAHGPSSSLAKLLWLQHHRFTPGARLVLHQADWVAAQLGATLGRSDPNNCLKLGYDPINRRWPHWLSQLGIPMHLFPAVVAPGQSTGRLKSEYCRRFNMPPETEIRAGTTDSTAAFIASGAIDSGDAVTALGSTLVLKVLSDTPIFSARYGVYSQPLFDRWLVGGASNSGGGVLLNYFNRKQLADMTPHLKPLNPTGLDYYPLANPGERFPISDINLKPRLSPRPDDDVEFFQGILEGIATIEQQGYQRLAELGAPYPTRIFSNGGGANNEAWAQIRRSYLAVPLLMPVSQHAAYGSALLCRQGASTLSDQW